MPRRKSVFARLTLLLLSIALPVLAAEFALRHWLHALPQLELDLYRRDGSGNLLLRPAIERRHVTRLWDVGIRLNSEGWRDAEPVPGDRSPAALGLGDSMAFGWGVEREESFLYRLEQRLREEPRLRVSHPRLLNVAVPGTGPSDQLPLLRMLWPRYRPRAVILSFFAGNDFVDVQMGGAGQFDVEDGLLLRRALADKPVSQLSSARARLVRSSRVLQLLRAMQLNWTRASAANGQGEPRHWDEWLREFAQIHRKDYPERTQKAVDDTLHTLDEMAALCRGQNVALILVIIPRSVQIDAAEQREMWTALDLSERDLDLDRPQRLLLEWAAKENVAAVDLLPAFRAESARNPREKLYYSPDAHMTPQGHRIAAEAVAADASAMQALTQALATTEAGP